MKRRASLESMRYMAIDYGSKRIGIALSDEKNEFALPKAVYPNDDRLLDTIVLFIRHNDVGTVVLGESHDFSGKENKIMKEIREFKSRLERATDVKIKFGPEFYTSAEAERLQGKNDMLDASAAALILKSYLDKKKNDQF